MRHVASLVLFLKFDVWGVGVDLGWVYVVLYDMQVDGFCNWLAI